jgi:hypothetical protein
MKNQRKMEKKKISTPHVDEAENKDKKQQQNTIYFNNL